MFESLLDAGMRPLARRLHDGHMRRLGIVPTMRLARAYNRLKYFRQDMWRCSLYQTQLARLLDENGPPARPPIEMHDGWAIDQSQSLPRSDRVLDDADAIINKTNVEAV